MIEIRENRSLTQEKAAYQLGVSLRKYQRWEHGTSTPSDNFEAIVNAWPEAAPHARRELVPDFLRATPSETEAGQ